MNGFSVVEMLIALAVIAIAFGALALTQVANLRASSRSRLLSDDKAAATSVLEDKKAAVLKVSTDSSGVNAHYNDNVGGTFKSFYFIDYYYGCSPGHTVPATVRTVDSSDRLRSVACTGTAQETTDTGTVDVDWTIAPDTDTANPFLAEGVVKITVRASHQGGHGDRLVLADRLTCYDVYPSPTSNAPVPCPTPASP